jgi:GT2 family glycosyltransferase
MVSPSRAGRLGASEASDAGPDVSIVVIGHSVKDELEACFHSIDEHAGVRVETIYVDNGSDDGTCAWLVAERPEIQLIELPENVWDAARKPGLARARGRYTMFLDSDAVITEGALPAMVSAMDRHPEWGLLGPRLVYEDGGLQLSCRRFPPPYLPFLRRPPLDRLMEDSKVVRRHLMVEEDHERVRGVVYVIGACQLFRTEVARGFGGVDPAMGNAMDVDFCLRFWQRGLPVVYFPRATVEHRYRRLTRTPLSRGAWRHLKFFMRLQWVHRREYARFRRLGERLDREGSLL